MTTSITKWIIDHRKFIIASWFVIAVVMISPAVSSIDKMDITMDNMDSRYTSDQEYLSHYFDDPELDYYRMPIVVIDYWNNEGYRQIQGDASLPSLSTYITDRFRTDDKWNSKIDLSKGGLVVLESNGDTGKGSQVLGILFNDNISDEDIKDMTDSLRASVDQYKDDYMYELYEKTAYFDVHLAGNAALMNDTEKEFDKCLLVSIIIVSIFTLLLMGLVFGSAYTALISAASMATTAVITLAMMYFITAFFSLPYMVVTIILLLMMILSFAHSIMTFSFYRNELINGKDKDAALCNVLDRTFKIFVPFAVCFALCCIVLMCTNSQILFLFGLCGLIGDIILTSVSMTLPISLMNLTKNELLWKIDENCHTKHKRINSIYSSVDRFFFKISELTGKNSKRSLIIIAVVLVILVSGGLGYIVKNDSINNVSYDTFDVMSTGDSREAVNVLVENSVGGISDPYEIVIKYDKPIAYIERIYSAGTTSMYLHWNDTKYYKEIRALESKLGSSYNKDVFEISSVECWDVLVQEAKNKYPSLTGQDLIDQIVNDLKLRNMPASIALKWELDDLSKTYSPYFILEYCGTEIDYSMNYSTGTFGYHMNESGTIVVDHIKINMFMTNTATSSQSMDAANRICSSVNEFVTGSSDMSEYRAVGTTSISQNISKEVESKTVIISVIMCLLVIIAAAIVERKLIFTVTGIVVSVSGLIISSALTFIIADIFGIGKMFFLMPLLMILTAMATSTWFDFMQCSEARYSSDVRTMKRCVDPIIIITSGSLVVFAISMAFIDINFVYQCALMIVSAILIQGLIMRLIISPHLWSFARLDLSKLRIRKEKTE